MGRWHSDTTKQSKEARKRAQLANMYHSNGMALSSAIRTARTSRSTYEKYFPASEKLVTGKGREASRVEHQYSASVPSPPEHMEEGIHRQAYEISQACLKEAEISGDEIEQRLQRVIQEGAIEHEYLPHDKNCRELLAMARINEVVAVGEVSDYELEGARNDDVYEYLDAAALAKVDFQESVFTYKKSVFLADDMDKNAEALLEVRKKYEAFDAAYYQWICYYEPDNFDVYVNEYSFKGEDGTIESGWEAIGTDANQWDWDERYPYRLKRGTEAYKFREKADEKFNRKNCEHEHWWNNHGSSMLKTLEENGDC